MVWTLLFPFIVATFVTDRQWIKDIAFRGGGICSILAVLVGMEYWLIAVLAVVFLWLSAWLVAQTILALERWHSDRFGIVLFLFCVLTMIVFESGISKNVIADEEEFTLTEEERSLIGNTYHRGVFDQPGAWKKFEWRVFYTRQREGSIENALRDTSLSGRIQRELYGIQIGLSNPDIGINVSIDYFEKKGLGSAFAYIAAYSVSTPIRSISQEFGGHPSERPLESLVGLTPNIRWLCFTPRHNFPSPPRSSTW